LCSEVTLIDSNARPDTSEQFLLGNELAGALNQDNQKIERTSADVNGRIGFKQEMRRRPQTKRPKPDRAVNWWRRCCQV
jgi:hypothetical protein